MDVWMCGLSPDWPSEGASELAHPSRQVWSVRCCFSRGSIIDVWLGYDMLWRWYRKHILSFSSGRMGGWMERNEADRWMERDGMGVYSSTMLCYWFDGSPVVVIYVCCAVLWCTVCMYLLHCAVQLQCDIDGQIDRQVLLAGDGEGM